jgi:O-glycosyl hydrolase
VNKDGTWTLEKREDIKGAAGRFEIALPACSAAVLTLEAN